MQSLFERQSQKGMFIENTERDIEVKKRGNQFVFPAAPVRGRRQVFFESRKADCDFTGMSSKERLTKQALPAVCAEGFHLRSEEERTEDALASGGDEGRGELRKFAGICKRETIRECPNGATRAGGACTPGP